MDRRKGRRARIVLWVTLSLAIALLAAVLAVVVPMLTHQSAGGSGQEVPRQFVAETEAEGADGRVRVLSAYTPAGEPADTSAMAPGDELVVTGRGFDTSIGIYVAICVIPSDAEQPPSPCLGGIPESAEDGQNSDAALSSEWITDDWAWRAFATGRWDDPDSGAFTARLTVPAPVEEGIDCREQRCAIATRADHTAGSDRVQDMLLPVAFG